MAKKGFNFINAFKNAFRRKQQNQPVNATEEKTVRQVKREKIKSVAKEHNHQGKQHHFIGGGISSKASNPSVIFTPKKTKFKGYMRAS